MANGPTATEIRHLRTLFAVGAAGLLNDGQLLERFATLQGDPAELAFATLVQRHGPMVLRVARSTCLDEHSAQDAFQATFLVLARKARSLWVRDSLGPWLHAVARRVASGARSAEARRKGREIVAARPEAFVPEDRARDELVRAIHQEIDRLPDAYRLAVETIHLDGLTQHEAAARLGWPVGTLQSRLARGRRKLRDRLERRGLAPSLAILAGKSTPLPIALAASTARVAATLQLGTEAGGMIAPGVLAMIEISKRGMLMTKLKLGALALVMASGLVGSGVALGPGRDVKATDDAGAKVTRPKPAEAEDTPPEPVLESVLPKRRQSLPPLDPATSGLPKAEADPAPEVQPPDFAVLLYFYAEWDPTSRRMSNEVEKLVKKGYPVKRIDMDDQPRSMRRYGVNHVPTTIVVDSKGIELSRLTGEMPASSLAQIFNSAWAVHAAQAREQAATINGPPIVDQPPAVLSGLPEPSLSPTGVAPPKPWETVVRIKLKHADEAWSYGSGTIIFSSARESIILTCAHTFRVKESPQPSPKDFRVPIAVDLFGSHFVRTEPAMLGGAEQDIPGEVIDYDFTNDVGLVRIKPGRKLTASPVVPTSWQPKKGMTLTTVGCSNGNDATAWTTTILDPDVPMSNTATLQSFAAIKCAYQPKEGRSGGGLYTAEGNVAGVCLFADPDEHVGLYAVPKAIHRLLDRNHLSAPYLTKSEEAVRNHLSAMSGDKAAEESPLPLSDAKPTPPAATDRDRLDELERKLDRVLQALDALKPAKPTEATQELKPLGP